MLRDKSLIPLSHQHQKVLALCVRIDRAQPVPAADLLAWQSEIDQHFEQEIKMHFSAEENILFPTARRFAELVPLVEELIADHTTLRESFSQAQARRMSPEALPAIARQLSAHIRKEERQLFEQLQKLMTTEELTTLGAKLDEAIKSTGQSCILTNEATKLKPKRSASTDH